VPRPSLPVVAPDWVDPEAAFVRLFADRPHAFWLDAGVDATEGWSWMGSGAPEPDPLRPLRQDASAPAVPSEVGRFRGGWVGWMPYDGTPAWIRVETLLAFDHARRCVWIVAGGPDVDLSDVGEPGPPPAPEPRGVASGRHTPRGYTRLIESCRERIREGDAYQLCLTTRFSVPGAVDPVATFRRLRRAASSHHGGLVQMGDTALVSASPERFVEVGDGRVHTHPIKGTRPRSDDPHHDRALIDELRSDPKERAENVMIVDLMRNDLSRVCTPASVGVDRLLEVETYPTVHQLVSEVSGELRPGTTLHDVVAAAFPAGSMTGAPKASAMAILAALEGAPRGIYSGAFGWVGDDGATDLAMVIRSIVCEPDATWVGAGGGITWRSVAAAEVAEVGVKARAPLAAVGAVVPPGW